MPCIKHNIAGKINFFFTLSDKPKHFLKHPSTLFTLNYLHVNFNHASYLQNFPLSRRIRLLVGNPLPQTVISPSCCAFSGCNHWQSSTHRIQNSKTFRGLGASLEMSVSLRTTVILAEEAASPPGLFARQVYLALWWRAACRILRQQVPLILVIMNSGELSMLWSSRYQEIVGDGIPVTWHSMERGELSKTSTDLRFLVKSGGKICWCVSEISIVYKIYQ